MKQSLIINKASAIYHIVFFIIFTCDFYYTTTFKALGDISLIQNLCRLFAIMLTLYKYAASRYHITQLLIYFAVVLIAAISFMASRQGMLLDFVLLALASRGVDEKRIVRSYLILGTAYTVIAFVSSVTGLILNYATIRAETGKIRYAFGTVYATDFAARVFFLILAYHYIRKRKLNFLDIIIHIATVVFLEMYCNARFSEILIILTLVVFFLYDYHKTIFCKKWLRLASVWSIAVCAIFSICMTLSYDPTSALWNKIDSTFFSNRLLVGKKVIDMYGFSWFGQIVKMQGMGFKTNEVNTSLGITYIDSSYLQILLLYGIVFFVIIILSYVYIGRKIDDDKNIKLSIILIIIAISNILNQYIIDLAYNPFAIAFCVYLFKKVAVSKGIKRKKTHAIKAYHQKLYL